jgi:hypothetical protein
LVIRHIPSLSTFAFPHEVHDPSDVALAVKELADPHARAEAVAAADGVLAGNNSELQRSRLLEAYRIALKSANAPL